MKRNFKLFGFAVMFGAAALAFTACGGNSDSPSATETEEATEIIAIDEVELEEQAIEEEEAEAATDSTATEGKCGEGKCGEGKCGDGEKAAEGEEGSEAKCG